jgi:hypothetical protein
MPSVRNATGIKILTKCFSAMPRGLQEYFIRQIDTFSYQTCSSAVFISTLAHKLSGLPACSFLCYQFPQTIKIKAL